MLPNMFMTNRFLVSVVFCVCVFISPLLGLAAGPQLNLNTATAEQLEGIKGIGAELAQRILDYRADHGPFKSIDELRNVKGIGKGKLEKIRDLVTVDISAQSATGSTKKRR